MTHYISKIRNHVYVENGQEAVKFYKEAFNLELSEPWLDDDGLIVHQDLLQNGELYLSISERKYLPDRRFIDKFTIDVCPAMLFYVFFSHEADLRRTFEMLKKDASLCKEVSVEEQDWVCEVIDQFGVFWHLRVPKHLNESGIPEIGLSIE
ncbi:hypothetical protein FACS1894193_11720 [Bacilli bacterium]|nr:hypothetical protein FACS1894193_11720 [Bacilli bacterium]